MVMCVFVRLPVIRIQNQRYTEIIFIWIVNFNTIESLKRVETRKNEWTKRPNRAKEREMDEENEKKVRKIK